MPKTSRIALQIECIFPFSLGRKKHLASCCWFATDRHFAGWTPPHPKSDGPCSRGYPPKTNIPPRQVLDDPDLHSSWE